mmetsp:Transcript_13093/g.36792  ORF Transcript_13093/g.36792 Transcript_13093/m.36792 type:complete len:370 (-) Transcript_13093:37-1146(-)
MDVGRPNRCPKQHELVRQRVHWKHEQGPEVRDGLQDPVQGVEGEPSKRGERVLLVVLVVDVMQLVVTQPEIVKQPVVPVDPKLHEEHVEEEGREVGRVAVLVHPDVRQSPPALHDVLAQRRQEAVHRQGPEAHLHLLRHVTELWRVRLGEEGVAVDAVDVVRPGHPETQVDQVGEHEAPEPGPRHQGPRVQLDRLLQALGKEAERQPVLPLGLLLQQVPLQAPVVHLGEIVHALPHVLLLPVPQPVCQGHAHLGRIRAPPRRARPRLEVPQLPLPRPVPVDHHLSDDEARQGETQRLARRRPDRFLRHLLPTREFPTHNPRNATQTHTKTSSSQVLTRSPSRPPKTPHESPNLRHHTRARARATQSLNL